MAATGAPPFGALYSDLYDAPFPFSPLGTGVELYLGPAMGWTGVSKQVYQRAPISIGDGHADEASQINPSSCTLTLNNRDNRFSINNPVGPYYGLLTRNTPLRVSVPNSLLPAPYNTSRLRMEDDSVSYASCPAVPGIELTGSIDIRVDVDLSGYGNVLFASIWSAAAGVNQRSWKFATSISGQLLFRYSTDGTLANSVTTTSDIRLPIGMGRQCFRATLDATTGNVAFYTAAAGNVDTGPWTQIGSTIPGSGPVTVFASTSAPLTVGYSPGSVFDATSSQTMNGSVYDLELHSASGVVAHPGFNALGAGTTSWTDNHGNVWSVGGSATIDNRSYRYHGELSQTPKASDPTGEDVYSQAVASGVLRRLQQAQSPINSPLYRAYARATGSTMPAAYWPCEDQVLSTQLASGLPGGAGMQISGTPQLAADSGVIGSAPLPTLSGATFRGTVPQGSTWTVNEVQFVATFPASPTSETNNEVIVSLLTTGTVARMDLQYSTGGAGAYTLVGYNSVGTQVFTSGAFTIFDGAVNGSSVMFGFGLQVVSGSVQWQIWSGVPSVAFAGASGTVTGVSLGAVTSVVVNPGGQCQQVSVGHVAVVPGSLNVPVLFSPFNAWNGETAANRVQRLCAEESVACRIYGHPELSIQMGPQTMETVPQLLQECETTDRGLLFEPMTCLGLGYRTLYSMYNQSATVTADYSASQLAQGFGSTADDLLSLNDVTATNLDGSSARVVLQTGTMSTQPPPLGIGRVDTSIQVNALSDGYLAGIASWILHVSTDSHDRFPTIPFNFARPQTPGAVAVVRVGDLLAVSNPPAWLQPDEIRQLAAGRTETLGPASVWEIDINGVPAYPYTIAQVAGGTGLTTHVDTDGSNLAIGVSATATTLSVATVSPYPIWTTNSADFPFDIRVGGERMTVTNITGAASPQSFTVTRSINGVSKTQTAGAALALWHTPIVGQITGA